MLCDLNPPFATTNVIFLYISSNKGSIPTDIFMISVVNSQYFVIATIFQIT